MKNNVHHVKVLVVTSTFPAEESDPVPAFVRDQITAIKEACSQYEFNVLAPHDARSHTLPHVSHATYEEYRFHYFWPFQFEKLAGRGIVPTLKQNPAYYALVPFLVIFEVVALWKCVRKLKPNIIYAHWFTPQGIAAGIVSSITKVSFVYTSHSSDIAILHKLPLFGAWMVRHFTARAYALTVVSRRSLEKLKNFYTPATWAAIEHKVAVIPMGIVIDKPSKPSKPKVNSILFLGRLAEKKGVQYLLSAFARIYNEFPGAQLIIAGDGPLVSQLKAQAQDLSLPNNRISFTGYVSGMQKSELINNADIFVVPSIITKQGDAEGLPVSLMEGLAAGKVCIATNESGADDILTNDQDGYLVPQKNVEALALALQHAMGMDSAQKDAIRKAARETAQQFAWPSIAKRHQEHLFKMAA